MAIVLVMYGAQAFLAWTAIADYTNGHHLFPEPWGGYAMAAVVELGVIVAFLLFRRSPWVAGVMLVTFATMSYVLQKLHAEQDNHPLLVAGIVPAALVFGGIALHLIKPPKQTEPVAPAPGVSSSPRTATAHLAEPTPRPSAVVGNGALTGKAKAMEVLRQKPAASSAEVMAAANVSERTVRNARADLKAEVAP